MLPHDIRDRSAGIALREEKKEEQGGSARGGVKIPRRNYFLRASVMVLLERLPSWRLVHTCVR